MAWPDGELKRLLDDHGFVLQRQIKHMVYKNPEGVIYVCASSPSDRWAYANAVAGLKRVLGLKPEPHKPPGERRERKAKHRRESSQYQPEHIASRPTWKDQLGVVRSTLHEGGVDRSASIP